MRAFAESGFYRGRSIFVTGHTGFKGAWLATWLKMLGARVSGFALPPEEPSLFEAGRVGEGMESTFADLRNLNDLEAALRAAQPEIVFHLAAQALVRRSYHDPIGTFATNVMGTAHLLDAVRRVPSVRAVLVVTSDKCYENREWPHAYREPDPMGGRDPYSSSKGCAELVTAAYRASFFEGGAAIATARAGNVIGGGDWAEDRIVPDLIRGLTRDEVIPIRAPHAIRPWQHVLEPLNGYLVLGQRLLEAPATASEGWNFGPAESSSVPVQALAEAVVQEWGGGRLELATTPPGLHEATFLALDWGKARLRLGWQPRLDFGRTVALTVQWYRDFHRDPTSGKRLTEAQIEQYDRSV
ncbi:MAG: CDP-glucose 4,6-dehydratase [Gemmatimonadota bacterium]